MMNSTIVMMKGDERRATALLGARTGSTKAKIGFTPVPQDSLRVAQGGLSHDQAWLRTARRREGGIAR